MINFMNLVKNEILENYNESVTENGAKGYKTTGKALLDLNFAVASLHNVSEKEIIDKFEEAYREDPALAITWLFYVRDIREGLGERRLFRVCFRNLFESEKILVKEPSYEIQNFIKLVADYGRYDDIWSLIGINSSIDSMISLIVAKQLDADIKVMAENKPVSLLAKWLPSESGSSNNTKKLAAWFIRALGVSAKDYRKTLSALRKYLDVTEVKMCNNAWDKIKYESVPSKASLNYKEAFTRHDEARYTKFIKAVNNGEAKINSATLYPHEIVSKYTINTDWYSYSIEDKVDDTLEALWKNLPDTVKGNSNTLVVADGSSSMTSRIGGNVKALDVANALAIYFAERASGIYKDKYITFSENPEFVDFSNCVTLREKIKEALKHDECANTNIYNVFRLILDTAITNNCSQEDLPKNILVLSDMEFNYQTSGSDKKLFKLITEEYEAAGYKLPKLIFWNLNSRTNTIPLRENDRGVALISGFSANLVKMVLDNETDPYKLLLKTLMSPRYKNIYDLFMENK